MTLRSVAVVLFALGASAPATSQTTWTQLTGAAPAARQLHAMVYDSGQQRILLFGGYTNPGPVGDTWQLVAGTWSQLAPAQSPPPRIRHAMAYDASRQRAVLFGGEGPSGGGTGPIGDTWEWDGSTWTLHSPATSPSPRFHHSMAYDAARQRVVLFGGWSGSGAQADTWEWDGTHWSQMAPISSPVARNGHGMAYDSARQRVVLFGGWSGSTKLADTWEWDGSSWSAVFALNYPPARIVVSLAYDAARQRVVLFGGDGHPGFLGDSWEFDGSNWTQLAPAASPSPRHGHAMAYDETLRRVVLFGGTNGPSIGGTWINGPLPVLPSALPYGSGCGAPPLSLNATPQLPYIGSTARVTVSNVPNGMAMMMLGWSAEAYGPFPLPVTLASLGLPGCDLLQSAEIMWIPTSADGTDAHSLSVPIPSVAAFIGGHIYLQAVAPAPGFNSAEYIVSNGVDWLVGG